MISQLKGLTEWNFFVGKESYDKMKNSMIEDMEVNKWN